MKNQKKASGIFSFKFLAVSIAIILTFAILQGFFFKKQKTAAPEVRPSVQEQGRFLTEREQDHPQPSILEEAPAPSASVEDIQESFTIEKPDSLESFQEFTWNTLNELPVLEDFKKLSRQEVHHTPEIIKVAGDKLGIIAEALSENPHFSEAAKDFYYRCLAHRDFPAAIRALCLANHRNLRIQRGASPQWEESEFEVTTEEIRDLAEEIPISF